MFRNTRTRRGMSIELERLDGRISLSAFGYTHPAYTTAAFVYTPPAGTPHGLPQNPPPPPGQYPNLTPYHIPYLA